MGAPAREAQLVVDATDAKAPAQAAAARRTAQTLHSHMTLSIGGPRESEAPGIYTLAKTLIAAMLDLVR